MVASHFGRVLNLGGELFTTFVNQPGSLKVQDEQFASQTERPVARFPFNLVGR